MDTSYLMMLYVTLDQERALKQFFIEHGWMFNKPDLTLTTDKIGPPGMPALPVSHAEKAAETPAASTSSLTANQTLSVTPSVFRLSGRKRKLTAVTRRSPPSKQPKSHVEAEDDDTIETDFSNNVLNKSANLTFPITVECGNQEQVVVKLERADDSGLEHVQQTYQANQSDATNNLLDKEIEGHSDNGDNYDDGDDDNSDNIVDDSLDAAEQPSATSEIETVTDTKEDILVPYQKQITVDSPMICRYCGQLFSCLSTLTQHIMEAKHTNPASYQCMICGKVTFSKSSHKLHLMRKHADSKSYECINCGKSFATEIDLKRHNDRENKVYKYKCDFCNYACEKKSEMRDHESSHTGTYNHFCAICGNQYRHRSSLRNHLQLHTQIQYQCEMCDKKFQTRVNISRHMRLVHRASGKSGWHAVENNV